MVVKFDMPGEKGASLEQLAYGMVEKIARQTTSLEQGRNNSAIKGLNSTGRYGIISRCQAKHACVVSPV